MSIPTFKRTEFVKTIGGKRMFRLLLALLVCVFASFSGAAMAGTPDLPQGLKPEAKGRMVLLDFYSAFCSTCQMMEPHLKTISTRLSKDVLVERVDLGKPSNAKYLNQYDIQGTPTYVLFDAQGKPLYRMADMITPVVLERQILRLTGQLKTVQLPQEFPLPKPEPLATQPLSQMILVSMESDKCADCKEMNPYLHGFELAGQQGLKVVHLNMDTPAGKKLMTDWSVTALPAYLLLDNSTTLSPKMNERPELFRMAGKVEPRALWDVIRMFGEAGV